MNVILNDPELNAATNLGIFNCRPQNHPSNSAPSVHGNGRAGDSGFPGRNHPQGFLLRDKLISLGRALPGSVQFVIWSRHKYGCAYDWEKRPYGGYPHEDHVHWELTHAAGETLTAAQIRVHWPTPTPLIEEEEMETLTTSSPRVTIDRQASDRGFTLAGDVLDAEPKARVRVAMGRTGAWPYIETVTLEPGQVREFLWKDGMELAPLKLEEGTHATVRILR